MKNFNFFDIVSPFFDKIVPGAKKSFDIIEKNCNIKVADKILDLGGGSGRIASFFINKAREITVVDSSRGMIKQCEKRKGINCILADAENLPFRDGYFDKIIIVDALHHFHNQESVIREVARVLKKEGKLVIEEFNPEKIIGRLIEFFEEILNMHSIFYSPRRLSDFLSRCGFGIKLVNDRKSTYYIVAEKISKE
ncbi:MAG: hypothetical protein A2283_09880 [Lentisphaerae bacterium RIFOXYA12_FULL_48_11]|nr:MAG: hypothetical protein A2259_01845 [Candidatus Moranbacteria bacterium RIFOXYA2_FULL_43_15]OGV69208.1 MAG: hypothetical protein A2283_09880 [Lentisphaerae bacterium RIFOXYA12_FULL_48_11]